MTRPSPSPALEAARLLAGRIAADTSVRRRAEYSSDASNYRVVPEAVLFPAHTDDVQLIVDAARQTGATITPRGGGTSVAGNAIGTGLVVDFSRHLHRIVEIDAQARTARVEPGVVLADLQRAAAVHGLRFGPDPSTQSRCTLGGMIGTNACGPRAVAWGRTVDNVRALEIVDGNSRFLQVARGFDQVPKLADMVNRQLATIRTELGRFARQASGYGLEHLLPENGRHIARALVGSEGTCGLTVTATLDLVARPTATALAVLGYPDMASAADDVMALMALRPLAVEGMDAALVAVVRAAQGNHRVPDLPRGAGWLFVETGGESAAQALAAAAEVCRQAGTNDHRVVAAGPEATALWRIREDGVGLAGRTPAGDPAWPGWEDAAVPPAALGAYLRAFDELKTAHGVSGLSYGHFGDGCIHTRLDLPISTAPERFRDFLTDAARLVVSFGGSLSGEHGDGRARSELLSIMYSPAALGAFAEFKKVFDSHGVLNPGVIAAPAPLDADLRLAGAASFLTSGFALTSDHGDFSRALHRCVGVGKCRSESTESVMCPSFRATRDEKDSTRGRARVLQEMINGTLVRGGWSAPEVSESLDLCLSCKACVSDCPAGVDMATYKSEVLYQRYRGRIRPISHYVLGRLPMWLRAAAIAPTLVNRLAAIGGLRRLGMRVVGLDPRREIPSLSIVSFRKSFRQHFRGQAFGDTATQPEVVLWIDTFTDAFAVEVARSAVRLLESAGYRVVLSGSSVCCGLTWITTGQLDSARRKLRATVAALAPHIASGRSIVGLEPSCTAVLRSDLTELLPVDSSARDVAANTFTLAEFLLRAIDNGWRPPDLTGLEVVAQPHCHQHAVMGFATDQKLLENAGASVTTISGCCGLAGNFGMEKGHYDLSVAVAENALLPALRGMKPDTVLLADGFSCRTQAAQLAGRQALHLAQLLDRERR